MEEARCVHQKPLVAIAAASLFWFVVAITIVVVARRSPRVVFFVAFSITAVVSVFHQILDQFARVSLEVFSSINHAIDDIFDSIHDFADGTKDGSAGTALGVMAGHGFLLVGCFFRKPPERDKVHSGTSYFSPTWQGLARATGKPSRWLAFSAPI
jgi:hypothetical protein